MKKVIIVGAGTGGLATGVILSAKGYEVHIYEKDDRVGGRMQRLDLGDYIFDTGPTFLYNLVELKAIFKFAGTDLEDEVNLIPVDPMYALHFENKILRPTVDRTKMRKHLEDTYPEHVVDYFDFLDKQEEKYQKLKPLFLEAYHKPWHYLRPSFIKALPHIKPFTSLDKSLRKQFANEDLITAMSFQTKYLGMGSWKTPSLFSPLVYLEHRYGLVHVEGGTHQINHALKKLIISNGGKIHLNKTVKKLIVRKNTVYGVQFTDNTHDMAKKVVSNVDFPYMNETIISKNLKDNKKLPKMNYSVSTFMLYLGLDKLFDIDHHTMLFSDNYAAYVKEISEKHVMNDDITIYIQNPSKIDKTLTKNKDHSALYIMVPVPNNLSEIAWDVKAKQLREIVFKRIKEKLNIDIEPHIVEEKCITPKDWEYRYNIYLGAVFGLGHNIKQLFTKRPHNKYQAINNFYLVGASTHPGSSLSSIYQSSIITSNLITNSKIV